MLQLLFWNSSKERDGREPEGCSPVLFWGGKMERKRVAGRFVRDGLDADGGARPEKRSSPGPKQCRTFTRARIAEALPEIVEKFVDEARNGSVAHAKALASLGGLDKEEMPAPKRRKGKTAVGMLLEKLANEKKAGESGQQDKSL
jgi:hypothetical protein